jgi:hypothetical protein
MGMIQAAGVSLQDIRRVLERLAKLKDRRDQGGHASRQISTEQLHRQRVAIFDEHLLKDFLSALSPRTTI